MRFRSAVEGERDAGEVGDLMVVEMQVDEMLRMRVRRGKRGEEGVGDLLVNMRVRVADGDEEDDAAGGAD